MAKLLGKEIHLDDIVIITTQGEADKEAAVQFVDDGDSTFKVDGTWFSAGGTTEFTNSVRKRVTWPTTEVFIEGDWVRLSSLKVRDRNEIFVNIKDGKVQTSHLSMKTSERFAGIRDYDEKVVKYVREVL